MRFNEIDEARKGDPAARRSTNMRDRGYLHFIKIDNNIVVRSTYDMEGRQPSGFEVTLPLSMNAQEAARNELKLVDLFRSYFERPDASFYVTAILPKALARLPGYESLSEVRGVAASRLLSRLRRLNQFRVLDDAGVPEFDELPDYPFFRESLRVDVKYKGPEQFRITEPTAERPRPFRQTPQEPQSSVWGLMRNPTNNNIEFTLNPIWIQFVSKLENYQYKRLLVEPGKQYFSAANEHEASGFIADLQRKYDRLSPESQRQIGPPTPRPWRTK